MVLPYTSLHHTYCRGYSPVCGVPFVPSLVARFTRARAGTTHIHYRLATGGRMTGTLIGRKGVGLKKTPTRFALPLRYLLPPRRSLYIAPPQLQRLRSCSYALPPLHGWLVEATPLILRALTLTRSATYCLLLRRVPDDLGSSMDQDVRAAPLYHTMVRASYAALRAPTALHLLVNTSRSRACQTAVCSASWTTRIP